MESILDDLIVLNILNLLDGYDFFKLKEVSKSFNQMVKENIGDIEQIVQLINDKLLSCDSLDKVKDFSNVSQEIKEICEQNRIYQWSKILKKELYYDMLSDPNQMYRHPNRPIDYAIYYDDYELFDYCISKNVNITIRTISNGLIVGKLDMVKELIDFYNNQNPNDNFIVTGILTYDVIKAGKIDIVNYFLDKYYEWMIFNDTAISNLSAAMQFERLDILELLLKRTGDSINFEDYHFTKRDRSNEIINLLDTYLGDRYKC